MQSIQIEEDDSGYTEVAHAFFKCIAVVVYDISLSQGHQYGCRGSACDWDMEKGPASVRNSTCSYISSLLPPKIPIPATVQSYREYVGHESNPHHRRTSSESLVIEEKPCWFDELQDEPKTPACKGGHRRSSSDSFAYTDAGNVVSNIVQRSGSAQSLQKEDGIPSLASEGKEAAEPATHDSKGCAEESGSSHGKPSPSVTDTKCAKRNVGNVVSNIVQSSGSAQSLAF